ncbi:MAG: hypothetical protein FJ280_27705 [Planctomycetes bacterium]|nr:hypothetical protein [Planctomycetota bacterium]
MTTGWPCRYPNSQGLIPFATVTYLYTGPPGTLTPIPYQAGDGGVFANCNNDLRTWDTLWSGPGSVAGIGMEAPYPYGCGGSGVEDMTWGSIKAMYH